MRFLARHDPTSNGVAPCLQRGRAVAQWLFRSWRGSQPEPLDLDGSLLHEVAPFLLGTGAGSLAFARLSSRERSRAPQTFKSFQQAYRWHAAQTALHESRLSDLVEAMDRHGVPFLLTKGWAIAQEYAQTELRPYGDFDLAFEPRQLDTARSLLIAAAGRFGPIDLHAGVPDLVERSWEDLWQRRRRLKIGSGYVCVLSREDQLRHACLHLLRHGLWRPLWLCDIGAMLDRFGSDFDWDLCLAGPRRLTDWILVAVGLAERLLGARAPAGSLGERGRWLAERWEAITLRQWGQLRRGDSHSRDSAPITSYLARPWHLWRAIGHRWPNPVEAAFKAAVSPCTPVPLGLVQTFAFARRLMFKAVPNRPRPRALPAAGIETHDTISSRR